MNHGPFKVSDVVVAFARQIDGNESPSSEDSPISLLLTCGDHNFSFELSQFFAELIATCLSPENRDDRELLASHGSRLELVPADVLSNDELAFNVGEFPISHNNENDLQSLDANGVGDIGHIHSHKDTSL